MTGSSEVLCLFFEQTKDAVNPFDQMTNPERNKMARHA
jgi:hypothetical protein